MKVKDVPESFVLLQDSQEVKAVLERLGVEAERASSYGCLFVRIEDGDYEEVYALEGFVPYLKLPVERLRQG